MSNQKGASEMPFERSLEIECRLEDILRLIRTGRFSTPLLAERLGVSIPTISRCVSALRERGHSIRSVRHPDGWQYIATPKTNGKRSKAGGKGATRTGT
jgi:biotin operon repressor